MNPSQNRRVLMMLCFSLEATSRNSSNATLHEKPGPSRNARAEDERIKIKKSGIRSKE